MLFMPNVTYMPLMESAECRCAECRCAECRYAECRGASGRLAQQNLLPLKLILLFQQLVLMFVIFRLGERVLALTRPSNNHYCSIIITMKSLQCT